MAQAIPGISEPHELRTRMVGRTPVIDLHIRLPAIPARGARHRHTVGNDLRHRFGKKRLPTFIWNHILTQLVKRR